MTDRGRQSESVPLTEGEQAIADALYAGTWTEPKPAYGDEWHHRFPWWMCVRAARIMAALEDRAQAALREAGDFACLAPDENGDPCACCLRVVEITQEATDGR